MSYLSHLSNGTTIDGDEGGNTTCFLNRALSPNRQAMEVVDDQGRRTLQIVTLMGWCPEVPSCSRTICCSCK